MKHIAIFDSTLRDGAQGVDVAFSVNDKLAIAQALDDFGVGYIEAGNPASNPKDLEFFARASELTLRRSRLTAFGSTCRKDMRAEDDQTLATLLSANTPSVAIFGKSWDLHVHEIIGATLDENLRMIADSVRFLKSHGREVIFDAEHFFDGYASDPDYALAVLQAASEAGADTLVLCDTNGGTLPLRVYEVVRSVALRFPTFALGIHAHNDTGSAAANSLLAVEAGVTHVQGTLIGIGERCGNADLSTILPSLKLKMNLDPDGDIARLCAVSGKIAEIANIILPSNKPYVGTGAFAHKGGMHIDGVLKNSVSFEHVDPEIVGNSRRFPMSEVAGRNGILERIKSYAPGLTKDDPRLAELLARLKTLEN
ncbi:MAG: citramalate synthase, partial [Oscillospiraceae bacterium]|nr:citramalate synthase [Oscillospiraceae bacterium]